MPDPSNILRYTGGTNYTECDVLFIESEDEEIAKSCLTEKKPLKCFAASKDNLEKWHVVFNHYVKYLHAPQVSFPSAGDSKQFLFFALWENLVRTFNSANPHLISEAIKNLRQIEHPFFPRFDALLNALEYFSNHYISHLIEATPFVGRDLASMERRWSIETVNWTQILASLIGFLKQMKEAIPFAVPTLESLIEFTRKSVRAWEGFAKMSAHDKCFNLSAYAFGLSELFYARRECGVALLLLHRSFDFYFSSHALDAGILVETDKGFKYSADAEAVNLLQTVKKLNAVGFFAPGLNVLPTVRDLNDARNLHFLTHHVYGIRAADVAQLRARADQQIGFIEGGTTRWIQAKAQWLPVPKLDVATLFQLEPSLNTFIAEVVL